MNIAGIHHIAIIASDYACSKHFYTQVLGLSVISEYYREDRRSYKLNLAIPGGAQIELFSFPDAPKRLTYPEACGLRHLSFAVADLNKSVSHLEQLGICVESVRVDDTTGKRFTFFSDPDGLPIELYETPLCQQCADFNA
jgi:glyoxylase I family protein